MYNMQPWLNKEIQDLGVNYSKKVFCRSQTQKNEENILEYTKFETLKYNNCYINIVFLKCTVETYFKEHFLTQKLFHLIILFFVKKLYGLDMSRFNNLEAKVKKI